MRMSPPTHIMVLSKIFKQALVFPGNGEYTKHMSTGTCIPHYCMDLCVKSTGDYTYISGLHHWITSLDYIIGLHHWITSLDYITELHHRITSLDYITGLHHWITSLDYITGLHHWNTSLEYITGLLAMAIKCL